MCVGRHHAVIYSCIELALRGTRASSVACLSCNCVKVELAEWLIFLRENHEELRQKTLKRADTWLNSLLFTLKRGCGVIDLSETQKAEVTPTPIDSHNAVTQPRCFITYRAVVTPK